MREKSVWDSLSNSALILQLILEYKSEREKWLASLSDTVLILQLVFLHGNTWRVFNHFI